MNVRKKDKKNRVETVRLAAPSGIRWTIEQAGVILINENTGATLHVGYPEAALWDWIQRGYPFSKIVKLFRAVLMEDETAAQALAANTLRRWVDLGFLSGGKHG